MANPTTVQLESLSGDIMTVSPEQVVEVQETSQGLAVVRVKKSTCDWVGIVVPLKITAEQARELLGLPAR